MPVTGLMDHSQVYILVSGKNLKNRINGTYLTLTPSSDEVMAEEGTNRCVVLIKVDSGLWTATVSLMPNAPENDMLHAIAQLSRNTPGGVGFPFVLKHGRTNLISAVGFISRMPDISKSRTTADPKVWTFILPDFDGTIGGFSLNTNTPIPEEVLALGDAA